MSHHARRQIPVINVVVVVLAALLVPCAYFVLRSTPNNAVAAVPPLASAPSAAASATLTTPPSSVAVPTAKAVPTPLRVVGLGDSITQGNSKGDTPGLSWFGQLTGIDPHLSFSWNAGVYGQTTAAIRSRVSQDVIGHHAQVCLVMGGTNDIGQGVTQAVTIANLTSIVDSLKAARVKPILMSVPPRAQESWSKTIASLNTAIERLAVSEDIPYVNVHDAVSTASGVYQPGDSDDGVHPTVAAHHLMAVAAATQLAAYGL